MSVSRRENPNAVKVKEIGKQNNKKQGKSNINKRTVLLRLGYLISEEGIEANKGKTDANSKLKSLEINKELG